MDYLAVRVFRQ